MEDALSDHANLGVSILFANPNSSYGYSSPSVRLLMQINLGRGAATTSSLQIVMEESSSTVIGVLLSSLNSFLLFQNQLWLSKELLPSIVNLIRVLDKVNRKLFAPSAKTFDHLQDRSEYVEGPSKILESLHPYTSLSTSKKVVTIPGAVFLSVI
eukprot:TRINITY_DN3855_c0_g1_i2.p1 TRINITY_DN3855_c0_g1~~TRINITY_DN3855_c0_g1_i2.p1  ORF type:complete len:155 (+),score=48.05 TRINITY_DN3855_c0_g1_i2:745-1209(+)